MITIEAHLIEAFILMNRFLQTHQVRYCLIGGLAAGYWGEPRFTRDMDFTVVSQSRSLSHLQDLLEQEGFGVNAKDKAELKVLQKGTLQFEADLILAETEYQDWVVQRAMPIPMFEVKVPICSAEDLIILKLIANRRQDLLDIENVLKRHSKALDQSYLDKWLSYWELEERYKQEFQNH